MIRRFNHQSAIIGTLAAGPLLGLSIAYNIAKDHGIVVFESGSMTVVNSDQWRNYLLTGAISGFVPAVIIAVIFWKIYKKTPEGTKRNRLLYIMCFLILSLAIICALCMASFSGGNQ